MQTHTQGHKPNHRDTYLVDQKRRSLYALFLEYPKTFSMFHFQPLTRHVLLSSKAFRPY